MSNLTVKESEKMVTVTDLMNALEKFETVEVMSNEVAGISMCLGKAQVSFYDEDEEVTFFVGDYNLCGNGSISIRLSDIESIELFNDDFVIALKNGLELTISETPEIKERTEKH